MENKLTRVYDEIECKNYERARQELDGVLSMAPEDVRVLLAAVVLYDGDRQLYFYKKLQRITPEPGSIEMETIQNALNKEIYLYTFYKLGDECRLQLCLEAGASPNELYEELNYIADKAHIMTIDEVNYDRHDGYSTLFFDAVFNKNYRLAEAFLKAGATFFPEKERPIKVMNASNCANPARCAVMARIMMDNDRQMMELITQYIPEFVNIEFSHETLRQMYQCTNAVESKYVPCLYAGGIQTPLTYCAEYDVGDYYLHTKSQSNPLAALQTGYAFKPDDTVFRANPEHRYLDTAKWLIENGAEVNHVFNTVVFDTGVARPCWNVSILSHLVDKGNYEFVKLLVETGKISVESLDVALTWSRDKRISDYLVSKGGTIKTQPKAAPKSQSQSDGCYVATAVYGSYDCPEVWTLRRFRDAWLKERLLGRGFIWLYYRVSPAIVRRFGQNRGFNHFNRNVLDRFTAQLNKRGYSDKPYQD